MSQNTVVTNSSLLSEFKRIHTRDDHALENIFLVFTNFLDCSCIVGLQSSSILLNTLKRCLQYLLALASGRVVNMEKEEGVKSSVTDCGRTPLAEVLDQISLSPALTVFCFHCIDGNERRSDPRLQCHDHKHIPWYQLTSSYASVPSKQ